MPAERRRRLALVTPWFGPELLGGAERLAWELARALLRSGAEVDVLATTCRSFNDDWGANYHRAGVRNLEGITLRRFKVDSRDRAAFSRANAKLVTLPRISLRTDRAPLPARDVRAFFSDNISSSSLLAHLRSNAADYDAILFVPYLYGPVFDGIPLVAARAFLIPCLHDEAYAYCEPVRTAIGLARGLLFNSAGEAELAAAIYGPAVHAKSAIVGHAVEPVQPPRIPIIIGSFAPHRSRYILYLGRQDRTKNVDFLLEAYRTFRERRGATALQLVFAGPRPPGATSRDGIVWLDIVAEDAKAALLTYTRALAQPSLNESFSRAIYEAWFAQRPVIVHAECRATSRAVEESGGGWIGETLDDWVRIFTHIDESADDTIDAFGRSGWAAAVENGSWDAVAARVINAIDTRLGRTGRGLAVNQIVPLGPTAATRYAAALGSALDQAGAICTTSIVEAGGANQPRAGAHSIVHADGPQPGPFAGDVIVAHSGDAFVPESPPPLFAPNVTVLQSLVERGYTARLLPMPVDPGVWASVQRTATRTDDGRPALISIAPLTRGDAEALVEIIVAYLGIAGGLRVYVRADDCDATALATLERERRELDLQDVIEIVGEGIEERYAALRSARLAVALGGPLPDVRTAVDPLWFDLPVIAYDDPVVRETIEPCGLVLESRTPLDVAAVVKRIVRGDSLRKAMIAEGRRVRLRYAPETVTAALLEALTAGAPITAQRRFMRL